MQLLTIFVSSGGLRLRLRLMLTVVRTEIVGRGLRVEGRGRKVFQTNGQGLVCIDASWSVLVLAAAS